jgi:hypothetical protein
MRRLAAPLLLGTLFASGACSGASELPPPKAAEAPPPSPEPPAPAAADAPGEAAAVARGDHEAAALSSGKSPGDDKPLASAEGSSAGASSSVPGANLTVSGMDVDGVLIETLSCKVDGLGLLGAVVVGATLAKQRGALRACGLKAAVPVGWTIQRSSVIDATASSGDAKKDACIVRALKQIQSTDDGVCRAKVGLK